jgi:hypothetical protein
MRKKKKRASSIQIPANATLDVEQASRRIKMVNRLDLQLISLLKSPPDSLEPLGPLAGKSCTWD